MTGGVPGVWRRSGREAIVSVLLRKRTLFQAPALFTMVVQLHAARKGNAQSSGKMCSLNFIGGKDEDGRET
jgi:hypothetical protein